MLKTGNISIVVVPTMKGLKLDGSSLTLIAVLSTVSLVLTIALIAVLKKKTPIICVWYVPNVILFQTFCILLLLFKFISN